MGTETVKSQDNSTVDVHLSYFKQGDDMHSCIVENNGKMDVKASIRNHVALLQSVINHLNKINELIPEGNDLTLSADTHCISLSGNKDLLQKLVDNNLASFDEFDNSDYRSDSGSYSDSSSGSSDSD